MMMTTSGTHIPVLIVGSHPGIGSAQHEEKKRSGRMLVLVLVLV